MPVEFLGIGATNDGTETHPRSGPAFDRDYTLALARAHEETGWDRVLTAYSSGSPDEREEMTAVGMAAVYTHGTRGQRIRADDPAHREALLAAFYAPWASAVEQAVAGRIAATGRCVLLDVHSYPRDPLPYELHVGAASGAGGRLSLRPRVCLGTDPVHTPPWLVAAARAAFGDDVALDTPFSGAYVPLSRYGVDTRVGALMVEVRRDVPDTDAVAALARLVEAAGT